MVIVGPSPHQPGIAGYTSRELRRILREHRGIDLPADVPGADRFPHRPSDEDAIVLGVRDSGAAVRQLLDTGFLAAPTQPQGYSMRCGPHPADSRRQLLAIVGTDAAGTLYALRDLEHYHLQTRPDSAGALGITPFQRCEHPRIEYRGHWTWGCNMPDKPAWIENLSRWKLNELIHWDNRLPSRAREYVTFAHERGVRVVWGFGWGWCPDWNFALPADFDRGQGQGVEMCGSSEANLRFFQREILRKVREEYAPTGCDGIYFQAFTECPKCQCRRGPQRLLPAGAVRARGARRSPVEP